MLIQNNSENTLRRALNLIKREGRACLYVDSMRLKLDRLSWVRQQSLIKQGLLYGIYTPAATAEMLAEDIAQAALDARKNKIDLDMLREWRPSDEKYLLRHYKKMPLEQLANRLMRTPAAVQSRWYKLQRARRLQQFIEKGQRA